MKNTSWGKWAAIAEILSALAIVVTLLYLAVQTAQNTKALQASARQAALDTDLGLIYKAIEYPMLYGRSGRYPELSEPDLTEADLARIASWEIAMLRTRETYWLQ